MKKSLIALAALAAVSAASAQSSVTMYGLLDIGYGTHNTTSRDGTNFTKTTGLMDSVFGGPRIGFRGVEDLGGGLKASFVIEQGISATSANLFAQRTTGAGHQIQGATGSGFGVTTNRSSYLGLESSSLGQFRIGYQYTAAYELSTLSGYQVANEAVGGSAHTAGLGDVGGSRANGFTYLSPTFGGGFGVIAQYGALGGNEKVETSAVGAGNGLTTENNRRMGLMGKYANGPLSVALSYSSLRSTAANGAAGVLVQAAATNIFGGAIAVGTVPLTGANRTANLTQLGASYDFGVAKLAGTYNVGKNGGTATSLVNSRNRGYQVGVIVPFGAFAPYLQIGKNSVTPDAAAATSDVRTVQLGLRYSLSKRTMAYAMYGTAIDNAIVAAAGAGYKNTKTVVGIQHSF